MIKLESLCPSLGYQLTNVFDYDRFENMKSLIFSLIFSHILFFALGPADAFWVWTPETNKFINPKHAVKETPALQLEHAKVLYESKDYKVAIREFQKLLKHYPRAKEAPEAQFFIGQIYEEQGNLIESFKAYQEVIKIYPFSELSGEIVKRQYGLGERILKGENEKKLFNIKLGLSEFDVVEVFQAVIDNAPYGPLAAPAQYKIALYYQEKDLFQEAREAFEKVTNDYPDNKWAKAAEYQIAVTDAKQSTATGYDHDVTQSAVDEFERFVEKYPDATLSKDAQNEIYRLREKEAENAFNVAEFYVKQKQYNAAKIYFQDVVDEYRKTTWASKALTRIREINEFIQ